MPVRTETARVVESLQCNIHKYNSDVSEMKWSNANYTDKPSTLAKACRLGYPLNQFNRYK